MEYREAISNGGTGASSLARSGAIRSGAFNRARVVVSVDGAQRAGIETHDLRIQERPGSEPSLADLTLKGGSGFVPNRGQTVVIGHGTTANKLFAGRLTRVTRQVARHIETKPDYLLEAVDHTAALAWSMVPTGHGYSSLSASSLVPALLAAGDPSPTTMGITARYVQAEMPVVAAFQVPPYEGLADAFDRLATLVGAAWYVDYDQHIHFYTTADPAPRPTITTLTPTSAIWDVRRTVDLSQVVTRAIALGEQVPLEHDVWSYETRLPVKSVDAITTTEYETNAQSPPYHLTYRMSAATGVLIDGDVRSLYRAYTTKALNGERILTPSPISITSTSFWVADCYVDQVGTIFRERNWLSIHDYKFRIGSVSNYSGSANELYFHLYLPAVGPGAPPPTVLGAIPASTVFTTSDYELVLYATSTAVPPRIWPAGTPIQAFHVAVNSAGASAVQSLCGGAPYGLITAKAEPQAGRPEDLVAACEALLAAGDPAKHERITFATRETQITRGQTVYLSLPSPGEPGGPTLDGTYLVQDVTLDGFDALAESKGPIRTITLGAVARPSLWHALK